MLASLAARAIHTVTSPFKPSASPAPLAAAAANPASPPSPSTRSPPSRAPSVESALSDLSDALTDAPAALAADAQPAADPARLESPTPASARAVDAVVEDPADDKPDDDEEVDAEDDEPASFAAKRTRTTRAGRAEADTPSQDDPSLGPDGKSYLLSGLYWSSALPRRVCDKPRTSTAPDDWREVEPTRGTALPPPVHHGETLVDDERAFRLPFDILRDCYFAPEAASRAGKGKGKGKGKGRAGGGEDEAPSGVRREGKGGDKTTAEDIAKREMSKKPPPYRYIGKSAFPSLPPSFCSCGEADRPRGPPARRADVYFNRRPDKAELPAICMCKLPSKPSELGCGNDCINRCVSTFPSAPPQRAPPCSPRHTAPADAPFGRRLMQYCCDPKKCPCGPDRCANLPLNKREGVPEGKDGLRVIWVRRGPLFTLSLAVKGG